MTTNHSNSSSSDREARPTLSSDILCHRNQPISAQALLNGIHRLPNPALIYSGGSGASGVKPTSTNWELPSRYAVLSWSPQRHLIAHHVDDLDWLISELSAGPSKASLEAEPHPKSSKPQSSKSKSSKSKSFKTGWMGYLSYDAGAWLAGLSDSSHHPNPSALQHSGPHTPLAEFGYYRISVLLDLEFNRTWLQNPLGLNSEHIGRFLEPLYALLDQTGSDKATTERQPNAQNHHASSTSDDNTFRAKTAWQQQRQWVPQWSRPDYGKAFRAVKDYLEAGDAYQVNLTMPFRCVDDLTQSNPKRLLEDFDAPFACYWKSEHVTLTSVSPERFLAIQEHRLITSPIKGTVARGESEQEDRKNLDWLRNSKKNQAENLMIVDLLRNDLGRSAVVGSVRVDKLFNIESHANVHHMVSTISAQLDSETKPLSAILAAFPGGSVTGAPKRRAMEIIAELETGPRGLYCGSFGYFDDAGHCDFNILIRSVVATKTGAEIWAGGAIVMDSNPDEEYDELIQKVARIMATNI